MENNDPPRPEHIRRVQEAVEYVCQEAIPAIEDVIKSWHAKQKAKGLQPCKSAGECSSNKKKPAGPSSCENCIKWGQALEDSFYPQQEKSCMAWENVNATLLYEDHVQVSNAFAFHIPPAKRPTKICDYEVASILQIMHRYGEFHRCNSATKSYFDPYDVIHKVSMLWYHLVRIASPNNTDINLKETNDHFTDITQMVCCLTELGHFSDEQERQMTSHLEKLFDIDSALLLSTSDPNHSNSMAMRNTRLSHYDSKVKLCWSSGCEKELFVACSHCPGFLCERHFRDDDPCPNHIMSKDLAVLNDSQLPGHGTMQPFIEQQTNIKQQTIIQGDQTINMAETENIQKEMHEIKTATNRGFEKVQKEVEKTKQIAKDTQKDIALLKECLPGQERDTN